MLAVQSLFSGALGVVWRQMLGGGFSLGGPTMVRVGIGVLQWTLRLLLIAPVLSRGVGDGGRVDHVVLLSRDEGDTARKGDGRELHLDGYALGISNTACRYCLYLCCSRNQLVGCETWKTSLSERQRRRRQTHLPSFPYIKRYAVQAIFEIPMCRTLSISRG